MTTVNPPPDGARAIALVVAVAGRISLDDLVSWNVARPTDLWRWLEGAGSQGWIAEEATAGTFVPKDGARRAEVVAAARPEEWSWLLGHRPLAAYACAAAREAVAARRLELASRLYAALVHHARRDDFPGGPRGWLELLAEGVRLFRIADWLEPALLDEALSAAVALGDLALQGILAAARGFASTRTGHPEEASAYFDRALEAAGALSDRGVAFEIHVQIAFALYLQGRPHDAIATFERLLGDVAEDVVPLPSERASRNGIPESPLAVLAAIYAQVGHHGRGLEMLERLRATGKRLERPELVAAANTFLAMLHAVRREADAARSSGASALAYWSESGADPFFLWLAAGALAWALADEGRLGDAREVLARGLRGRAASGLMLVPGSHLLEVLDRLDVEGVAPPERLSIDDEIARGMGSPNSYARAVACRFRARRLARGEIDAAVAAEIDRLHAEGISLLRTSRAAPIELARALDEAGRWAGRRARADDAARLEAEARQVFATLGLGPAPPSPAPSRIAGALVELGRLGTLANRTEGVWGELASRLCAVLGAERCALVEVGGERPRALAARGGGASWVAAVEALAAARDARGPEVVPAPDVDGEPEATGQLAILPFASERLGHRGYAFLENRHSPPLVSPTEAGVLEVVQAQLGVVLENVALWRELEAARQRLEQENRYYREASPPAPSRGRIVGDSPALRQVLGLVARVAPTTTPVLVHGETGVGKELVAREIHRLSPRRGRPFIAVHIAALAPGLVASGLFGHERGAFTGATEQAKGRFELADGGTLFLDEIGELGPEEQVRLLRVLQEGTFERVGGSRQLRSDFRLVCATNRDLPAEVKAGRFREDLYFRLAAFPIRVPPLRERTDEIPTLALYFMENAGRKFALRFEGIGEADMQRLVDYPWPGNVRELEHVIERAALLSEPPRLRILPLQEAIIGGATAQGGMEWIPLEEAERRYVRQVLSHTHGRITGPGGAAEILGLKPSTLTWRIGKLGLKQDLRRARASRP